MPKKKLLQVVKDKIYVDLVQKPSLNDRQIGELHGVSQSYVYNVRQKFIRKLDYQLAIDVSSAFMAEFQMANDAFKLQITILEDKKKDLELLKDGTKTIFHQAADGHKYPEEVELNAMDKLQIEREIREIMKQQENLWKSILMLARQGEAIEVMKLVKNGNIRPLN